MASKLNPYLSFKDNAREVMEFYHDVFGGKLDISSFDDMHAEVGADEGKLIMHAQLEADNGITIMASDTPSHMGEYKPGSTISISLSGEDELELRDYWGKLSSGATITMPLEKAPWGDTFGMLTDKFGTHWMVNITGKPTA